MTAAQAQRCLTDLVGAGYDAQATQITAGEWQVSAASPTSVDQPAAAAFANSHGVGLQTYQVATSVTFR